MRSEIFFGDFPLYFLSKEKKNSHSQAMDDKRDHVDIEGIQPIDNHSASSIISTAASIKKTYFGKDGTFGELGANAVCIEGTYSRSRRFFI
jgi:hypothetical protein